MSENKNRKYFFVAVNTGQVENLLPTKDYINFYSERSKNGLHCTIVGNVVIPSGYPTNSSCAYISTNPIWEELSSRISAQGALPGIQLSSTWKDYEGQRRFISKNHEQEIEKYVSTANSIKQEDIKEIFLNLDNATDIAIKNKFKHLQIHAAHGYLFNLLVDYRINKNNYKDLVFNYLNNWTNRLREKDIESSIRLSIKTGSPIIDIENSDSLISNVSTLGFDYIDLSSGFYNINKQLIYPSTEELIEDRFNISMKIAKKNPEQNFIFSGKSFNAWAEKIPNNVHFGICRDLIANPNFMAEKNNGCINTNKCHYFSKGERHLTCGKMKKN